MYSIKKDSAKLLSEIENALSDLRFGNIEIYVVDGKVKQITKRIITKTDLDISSEEEKTNTL